MKCFCNVPGLGRQCCPMHNTQGTRGFARSMVRRASKTRTFIHGGGEKLHNIQDKTINLEWSLEELMMMNLEEMWAVANILRLPQSAPTIVRKECGLQEVRRHVKMYLGMYSGRNLEKYRETYTAMIPILEQRKLNASK